MVTEVDVVMCITCIYMFESLYVCVCGGGGGGDLELKRDHMLKEHLIRLI